MKNNDGRTILRLIFIGMYITGLVAVLAQCSGDTSPGPGILVEPTIPTAIPAPTETASPTQHPTPAPLYLTTATEVVLPTDKFRLKGLYDDTAVGIVGEGAETQVVILDLTTGRMHRIDSSTDARYRASPHISERWVVWYESVDAPVGKHRRLMVYDLDKGHEFQLDNAVPDDLDLSGDIVVWTESMVGDVFAHDLLTDQRWPVAVRPGGQFFPRISGQWVIYLEHGENWEEIKDQKYGRYADLRAYHLDTGEDFLIGQAPLPNDASVGTHHAIAGSKVVWIQHLPNYKTELRVYDLETRTSRPLVLSDGTQITCFLELFGDDALLVKGTRIYSLEDGRLLGVIDTSTVKGRLSLSTLGSAVYMSGNRVVLSTIEESTSGESIWRLYTLQVKP